MKHLIRSALCLGMLSAVSSAQLSDLQPGPNFELVEPSFGTERASSIDVADVDGDGDLDVFVAVHETGGFLQASRLFINLGGMQGGQVGSFSDQTSTRFSPVPFTHCRDFEFGDIDGDGDLDILMAHSGGFTGGEPGRWYVNRGGLQGGPAGYFLEETDARWGELLSVPLEDEIGPADGRGPWRENSCDCDFGDLDDDGDLDLFYSSYGPAMNGTRKSRIFLNDGTGVFDELWPWADPFAQVNLKTLDVDLADFDGDSDLDIFASRINGQARVYINNLYGPVGDTPFTDITRSALLATGAQQTSAEGYDAEIGDLDGDGDFDVWAVGYASGPFGTVLDLVLRNAGPVAGGGIAFEAESAWIAGSPSHAVTEVDLCDFDGDGDLDAWQVHGGSGSLFQSALAQQGAASGVGLLHITAGPSGASPDSAATWPEIPPGLDGILLDGECADLDNDGDMDLLWAQVEPGTSNGWYRNVLGVPDTHAPKFLSITDQCDKPAGTATVIHAAVRDNAPIYLVDTYSTKLIWTYGPGPERVIDMVSQGGMQFWGRIPAGQGTIHYRLRCTDLAGNISVTPSFTYTQSGPIWTDLQGGAAGAVGVPQAMGSGTWEDRSLVTVRLTQAAPQALAGLFFGGTANPQPFAGGVFLPAGGRGPLLVTTSVAGEASFDLRVPTGIPCGTEVFLQWIVADPAGLGGHALSNGLRAVTP